MEHLQELEQFVFDDGPLLMVKRLLVESAKRSLTTSSRMPQRTRLYWTNLLTLTQRKICQALSVLHAAYVEQALLKGQGLAGENTA